MKYLQCKNCGTVHYAVSRDWAEKKIRSNVRFYNLLAREKRDLYVGGEINAMHQFEHCHLCGNHYQEFNLLFDAQFAHSPYIYPIIS